MQLPPVIFGTSCLGNLYQELEDTVKRQILNEIFNRMGDTVVLDSAGKYGAGLALEVLGRELQQLGIRSGQVTISNKLGWYRVPLRTAEPTFEPGAWKNIIHDAVQKISYQGILACWEQGCDLLGDAYRPKMVSVHDPDEYLAAAENEIAYKQRFEDIVAAYGALIDLRGKKETNSVGVGAKNWKVIREISSVIDLDWVMFANSLTIYSHPSELLEFVNTLQKKGTDIINSAVFHAGFLTGGNYFDYRRVDPASPEGRHLIQWRDRFFKICIENDVRPAEACVRFAISHPGIKSIALNTSKPERIKQNISSISASIPASFWQSMKAEGLISNDYKYV